MHKKHSSQPLKAFTVGFEDSDAQGIDEIDDARQTAEVLGLEHHVVKIGFEDFIESLRDCVRIVEEPLATTSIVPMRYLSQLAAKHVKVVLSGQGADEPLGGYGRYRGELIGQHVPYGLFRAARSLARVLGLRNEQLSKGSMHRGRKQQRSVLRKPTLSSQTAR